MAVDVLDHHDGIDRHEPDRDGAPHQRNIVEAEIKREHRRKRAEQRQHHRHAGMNFAQKLRRKWAPCFRFRGRPRDAFLSCTTIEDIPVLQSFF